MWLGVSACSNLFINHIVSMTTTTTNSLSLQILLHSSNFLTVARMEMKLGTHACNISSMTTTFFEKQIASGNFLTNGSMLGGEAW